MEEEVRSTKWRREMNNKGRSRGDAALDMYPGDVLD